MGLFSSADISEYIRLNFLNLGDVTLIYVSVVVFLLSCFFVRKYVSNKFISTLIILKYAGLTACTLISLKYLKLNVHVGINVFYLYNVLQVLTVLEDIHVNTKGQAKFNEQEKEKADKKKESSNSSSTREKEDNGSESDEFGDEHMIELRETERQIEEIAESIKSDSLTLKVNDIILKEKEMWDEYKRKEKEEEQIMKKKGKKDIQVNRLFYRKEKSWLYTFFSQTFYIFFYYFYFTLYRNLFVLQVYITLQLMKNLVSLTGKLMGTNSQVRLFSRLVHILDMIFMFWISIIFTKILYMPDTLPMFQMLAKTAIVFHVFYLNISFTMYIGTYHKQFRPSLFTFLLFFHIFAIIGIYRLYIHEYGRSLFIQCIAFYLLCGLGITAGAHRLWSHRAYEAHPIMQVFCLILNACANQGSVITWGRNHRLHHKYTDTKYDPHDITQGFFYSHIGWLIYQKSKYVKQKEKEVYISDLEKNPLLNFQHKIDPYFNLFFCFVLPSVYGYLMYNSFWDGFFILGALRWVITLHSTWSVNSVSHSFGYKPYNFNMKPTDNIFTSLVALGEGSHNYHHVFPSCYAMNEDYYLISINPTRYFIEFCHKIGLAWNLKSAQNICKEVRMREAKKLEEKAKLLAENIKGQIMEKEDTSYITDLINSLQIFCNDYLRISTFMYLLYFLRDFIIISVILLIHLYYCHNKYGSGNAFANLCVRGLFKNSRICSFFLFMTFHIFLYAIPMGTMFTSLYSLIHECKRGLIFRRPFLNNSLGCFISSIILLPYTSDDRTNKSLLVSLHEDFMKLCKGPLIWNVYTFVLACVLVTYGIVIHTFGLFYFSIFFILPYLVFNGWLLIYISILKNPPVVCVQNDNTSEKDTNNINVLNYIAVQSLLQWKKQNSIYQSKNKLKKVLFSFMDSLHHHLCYTHVVEYIHSKIPSYRTKEIYKYVDKTLDPYFCFRNEKFVEILKQFL